MSADFLASVSGALLSLIFAYVPGLKGWFDGLAGEMKRGIMAALLLVVAAAVFGLACANLAGDFGLAATCDKSGLIEIVKAFVAALVANQATYALLVVKSK